jgi:TnpA family transposase
MRDFHYTREQIIERATFTAGDRTLIGGCRGDHNRLGFAYQTAFVRLKGRFPAQQPLEVCPEILIFASVELDVDPETIQSYALRQQTVSEHQEQIRRQLGLRSFGESERVWLEELVLREAIRLEQRSALIGKAQQVLQQEKILVPATATLSRIVGELRDRARGEVFARLMDMLSADVRNRIDALLIVTDSRVSGLHHLKMPPGFPSPSAFKQLTDKLDKIQDTGVFEVDGSWINNNFQKTLSKRTRQYDAHRLRELNPPHRYTLLSCFLWQTYRETIDHVVDMFDKLITRTYGRSQRALDEDMKRQRKSFRESLSIFRDLGRIILDDAISDEEIRSALYNRVSREELETDLVDIEQWLTGNKSDVFPVLLQRFSYLRQFAPRLLDHLSFHLESTGNESILKAIGILREMNSEGKRKVPDHAPVDFISPSMRRFVENNGQIDRRAYECAVLTSIRDEIKRGNLWVTDSKRFRKLDDFFIPEAEWNSLRTAFFSRAALPSLPDDVGPYLARRLNRAYSGFLEALPDNAYVTINNEGWRFGQDQGEKPDPEVQRKIQDFEGWLSARMRSIKLPNLLVEVDNDLHFTRHFISPLRESNDRVEEICTVIATILAHGCNIGPWTMSQLTNGVSYKEIKRVADWNLHEDTLRQALADVVNAIVGLDMAHVWGEGKTSSSDGQRFLFPRKILQRTYSPRFGDFAVEFYSFVADNYAPFYSTPIECTTRDAAYVLDGLLYHESDLDIEEHYVDTHGYTELNFAAFAMFGKRFCPRIRGLHHQWIYRIDAESDYGPLRPLVDRRDRTIHLDWICDQWDRIAQFFASFDAGHTTASTALRRLVSYGPKNLFFRAVRELGRVFKTEFILDYLSDPLLRRRTRQGLLKGEQIHALAREVHYGKHGTGHARDFQQQMSTASCLNLILACIVYWQAKEISNILKDCDPETDGVDAALLSHVSPIGWDNVVLYGDYMIDRSLVE